jgi:hypothetical protein
MFSSILLLQVVFLIAEGVVGLTESSWEAFFIVFFLFRFIECITVFISLYVMREPLHRSVLSSGATSVSLQKSSTSTSKPVNTEHTSTSVGTDL